MFVNISFGAHKTDRSQKGSSLIQLLDDYTIIDLETTGLSPRYDDIIELGAVRIRNGKITESFQQLINPGYEIDEYITDITGITNEMLASMPGLDDVIDRYIQFLGMDIIIGHNVNFDINFLYDKLMVLRDLSFPNSYIDTMRLSRKLHPEQPHHRLKDLVEYYNIPPRIAHRALSDCETTYFVYNAIKADIHKQYSSFDEFYNLFKKKKRYGHSLDLRTVTAETDDFDTSHPLYGKVCVFTCALERYKRADAAQIVVNCGGIAGNGVTKKTNYLILGNNDYCKTIKDGKSSKQKKAEEYIKQGCDLMILPEDEFYDMINE